MTDSSARGKEDMTAAPIEALLDIQPIVEFGKEKYGYRDWASLGEEGKRHLLSSSIRHLCKSMEAELDEDSGLPHINHAACNLLMLIALKRKENDQR